MEEDNILFFYPEIAPGVRILLLVQGYKTRGLITCAALRKPEVLGRLLLPQPARNNSQVWQENSKCRVTQALEYSQDKISTQCWVLFAFQSQEGDSLTILTSKAESLRGLTH